VRKTKSEVRPRKIQRTVLSRDRRELGVSRVEDAIYSNLRWIDVRRGQEVRETSYGRSLAQGDNPHDDRWIAMTEYRDTGKGELTEQQYDVIDAAKKLAGRICRFMS
jgi:hypothetical protein